jgi:hypothetical protein
MRTTGFWGVPARMLLPALSVMLTFAGASGAAAQSTAAAADSAAVVATVQRLFDAMAKRDTAAARAILLPGSQFISVRSGGPATGNPLALAPRRQSDTTFLRSLAAGRERLLERFWAPVVRVHGPLAEVWTRYDFHIDGKFSHCGIDSFSLLRTAGGWQIAGIVYTVESTGCAPSPLGTPK